MIALTDALIARIEELVDGLEFDHKPTGGRKQTQVVDSFWLPPTADFKEGDEYPMVKVAHYSGSFLSSGQDYNVVLAGWIWTSGKIPDGTADIKKLAAALGKIAQSRLIGGYRLDTPINYHFGDTEKGFEGIQPHPYHYVTFYLKFTSA